jgi:hypothetical protein
MPNLPISQLPASGPLTGAELFADVQDGVTKYTTLSNIATYTTYLQGNNYGLFNQTGSSTPVTNTTSELSLIGSGIGTLTVPANGFTKGDAYHAIVTGTLSSQNNNNLRIRIKTGAVVLADTGNINMAGATSNGYKLEIYFSIHEVGAAGVADIATAGAFMYTKEASTDFQGVNFSTINSSSFDTTVTNTLSVTAQWDTANAGNSIYSEIFTLNKTF